MPKLQKSQIGNFSYAITVVEIFCNNLSLNEILFGGDVVISGKWADFLQGKWL